MGRPTKNAAAAPLPLVHARCCGIDVHKDTVVACVRDAGPGGRVTADVRTFGTTTRALLELGDSPGRATGHGRGDGVDRRLLEAGMEASSRAGRRPTARRSS